jgi:ADP-dependent NAD(P)H-hydrate dehydratase / NAD(P)H-hydrate epimerase
MWELVTNAEMAEADRLSIAAGTAGIELMENAGRAVAEVVCRRQPPGSRIAIVAGPGNNGGDGFVAARHLVARGRKVSLLMVGDVARLRGDAAMAARRWAGRTEAATPAGLAGAHLIVDALFGAGLDRPVEGLARAMIEAINAAGVPVVAVDLASGVNGTTGAVMGVAVRADESITFFRKKIGHVLLPGRVCCGEVCLVDIGISAETLAAIRPLVSENGPPLWHECLPRLRADGHKYSRGHAVVVSGGAVTTGAARLAARGALRGGAGLVTIASPREALPVHAATNLAVMVRPVDGAAELASFLTDKRFNAVVLGPGLGVGATTRELAGTALAGSRLVVLDADALTSFAGHEDALRNAIAGRDAGTILTPHEGEFARLFNDIAAGPESKLEKARRAAARIGAVLVLKGADSVIAAPDGRAAINANAPPWLATAGSGDVLAGLIGGLGAQGMDAYSAACAAVWMHGEAARIFGPGLVAEDLSETLPSVWRRLLDATAV